MIILITINMTVKFQAMIRIIMKNHEDRDVLTKESNNSTSVSVTGLTSTSTFIQDLFLQYLYKTVITIYVYIISTKASLQLYTYYCHYNYLYERLYKKISYVVFTKASLPLYTYYRLYLHL